MKLTIRVQPLAQDDLRRQAEFIAKESLDAALRLLDAAEVTYDFLAETPLAGVRLPIHVRSNHGFADLENQRFPQPPDSLSGFGK
ncbi:MAG: type II toxin-antitoxin system RelE/ParE family toxin [Planctomycetota bacterium]